MVKRKRVKMPRGKTVSGDQKDDDLEKNEIMDQDDEDFFQDEIDKFHANKEKILLEDAGAPQSDDAMGEEEEEVLEVESDDDVAFGQEDWHDESSPSDDAAEEKEADGNEGIISRRAWGKKRSAFYGADDLKGLEGSDREEAEMVEEEEVLAIQKRLAEQIDEDDIGLDILQVTGESEESQKGPLKTQIMADFSNLSVKAQWKLAKKESPEMEGLIKDFKAKLEELKSVVAPLMQLVKDGKIPVGHGRDYITLKYRVYLAYLLNISFYLALKAKKTPIQNHPVVSRLVQYRTVINQLAPIDKRLEREIAEILQEDESADDEGSESAGSGDDAMSGAEDEPHVDGEEKSQPRVSEAIQKEKDVQSEKVALDYYKSLNEKLEENAKQPQEKSEILEDGISEERRAINYEIAKNKGLTQKKKKIDRNPRVKMRHKYRKAKIRRKGQVREYRPELKKYSGEASGIRVGLKKSISLQ